MIQSTHVKVAHGSSDLLTIVWYSVNGGGLKSTLAPFRATTGKNISSPSNRKTAVQ